MASLILRSKKIEENTTRCALAFVTDIDDVLFANLVDAHFQNLLEKFEALELGRPRRLLLFE